MKDRKTLHSGFNSLKESLSRSRSVIILTHISPDGDALGSMLTMKQICQSFHNITHVDAVIIGQIPEIYKFLPGSNELKNPDNPYLLNDYDVAVVLDCATKDRLAITENLFNRSRKTFNIDHHESNPQYADVNIVDPDAAATGEIIYFLMRYFDIIPDERMAVYLYTAILTDTGGFKYGNTSSNILYIAGEMVSAGANPQKTYQECYENKPLEMVKLHAECLKNVKLTSDNKIAWTTVTRHILDRIGAKDEYIEGMVELLRQIDTVEIALLFKETRDNNIKVSYRSKKVEIATLASSFNGGGHKFAAGSTLKGYNLATAIDAVVSKAKEIIRNNIC